MILISHRGNIDGKKPTRENSPDYILEAIELGYDVEVDVWYENGGLFLGHDKPEYETCITFLKNKKLWCHCKNTKALEILIKNNVHCFFHKTDDVTLTSYGYIWVFPRKPLLNGSVCVLPEVADYAKEELEKCAGICSDNIQDYGEMAK